jgi:general secretion pathway protein A
MYEHYYGFTQRPFQLSPDPKFFFASSHHQRALSYLQYGLDQGDGFIVITGPIGTGKTTLARNLLDSIHTSDIQAVQLVSTNLTPQELLVLVADQLHIDIVGNNKADLLKCIEKHLIQLHHQGKRALLIVDEAQNLPAQSIEELRMLSNFQLDNKPLIQSFLLGQEELKGIIQAPDMEQFRQRIIASAHLKALSCDQVKAYIMHRLHQAGCDKEALFSAAAFVQIHEKTAGVPRKINIFVDRLLLFGFLEELQHIDVDAVYNVAQEMEIELTGSLSPALPDDQTSQLSLHNAKIKAENIENILAQIEDILDNSIKQKIKMTRCVDKLLKRKIRQLSEHNQKDN